MLPNVNMLDNVFDGFTKIKKTRQQFQDSPQPGHFQIQIWPPFLWGQGAAQVKPLLPSDPSANSAVPVFIASLGIVFHEGLSIKKPFFFFLKFGFTSLSESSSLQISPAVVLVQECSVASSVVLRSSKLLLLQLSLRSLAANSSSMPLV